jgi:hypothetical protein
MSCDAGIAFSVVDLAAGMAAVLRESNHYRVIGTRQEFVSASSALASRRLWPAFISLPR